MSKYAFAAAAALSALIASSAAMADRTTISSTAAFTVSVEVLAGCTINSNGGDVTFTATAGTASKPSDITTSASITCTNGTGYDVSLTSTNGFKMVNGANSIAYAVASNNSDLIANNAKVSKTGDGTPQTTSLTFSILDSAWKATNKAGLTYSDTVTLNVTF